MAVMKTESEKDRARIIKKLNKRDYYAFYRRPLPEKEQHITGYVREEWCLLRVEDDKTITLCFITTPYHGRYGPTVMAKRRPNGRYWFISNAYADTLPTRYTNAMERLYMGDPGNMPKFDANDLDRVYD